MFGRPGGKQTGGDRCNMSHFGEARPVDGPRRCAEDTVKLCTMCRCGNLLR